MKIFRSSCLFVLCLVSIACNARSPADTEMPAASTAGTHASAQLATAATTDNPYARTPSQHPVQGESAKNDRHVQEMPDLTLGNHEKEISYYAFRKYVMANGWTPISDKKCMENVVGGDYALQCTSHTKGSHTNSMCGACQAIPELSSCGAGGVCLMRFHNALKHQDVDVGTTGDVTDWKGGGKGSSLIVTGWAVSPTATP